jgi:glycosyltransferase involved in cell wall biosynthesis
VIVSPNVGAKDLVVNGTNGYVTSAANDSDTAVDGILQLLDPVRCDRMGTAAVKTASDHDWERLVERLNLNYLQILESRQTKPLCRRKSHE